MQIFKGLVAGVGFDLIISNEYKHGYGLAGLIKHLINEYGSNILFKYYAKIATKKSAIESFLESIKESKTLEGGNQVGENVWLPEFYKQYVSSNIYSVPGEIFLNNISETIEFNDGDITKYADKTYNDLSAKLFKININSEEIKNNKSLNFKIGPESLNLDYVKTLVFGLSDDHLTYLSEGTDFSIGNLYKYDALIACVVNSGNEPPYTGTSNINLDIRVIDEFQYDHCDIKIRVIGIQDTNKSYWDPRWYTDGYFTNNIYNGKINSDLQGGGTGSIRVAVDDNFNILSLSVMASHDDGGFSSQWGFTAENIPPTSKSPYSVVCKDDSSAVCNYVTSIFAKYIEVDGYVTEITNFECDDNCYLQIKFHVYD